MCWERGGGCWEVSTGVDIDWGVCGTDRIGEGRWLSEGG